MCQSGNLHTQNQEAAWCRVGDVGCGVPPTWVPISAEICTSHGVLLFRILERLNEMPGVGLAHGRCYGSGGCLCLECGNTHL